MTACAVDGQPTQLPIVNTRADHKQGCCSASDAADARRVADRFSIPFYALNLQAEFREIIDYFVDEYSRGRTPNPCVVCNHWIKFGRLFDYADSIDADYVATGHYARLEPSSEDGLPSLHRGIDGTKDQSYVLFGIDRTLLRRMMLPIGGFEKRRIRELAHDLGLSLADKPDSQEICFVTSGKHDEFVRQRRDEDLSGDIVTTQGDIVGQHVGIERFTIGQRKGLGVAMGEPYFVTRIEPDTRRVVIGQKHELARSSLTAGRTNWMVDMPNPSLRCLAKIRYNSPAAPATLKILDDERIQLDFDEPRFGVAPGQAVVCYDGTQVLGGGWIE